MAREQKDERLGPLGVVGSTGLLLALGRRMFVVDLVGMVTAVGSVVTIPSVSTSWSREGARAAAPSSTRTGTGSPGAAGVSVGPCPTEEIRIRDPTGKSIESPLEEWAMPLFDRSAFWYETRSRLRVGCGSGLGP